MNYIKIKVLVFLTEVFKKLAVQCDKKASDLYHRELAEDHYKQQSEKC